MLLTNENSGANVCLMKDTSLSEFCSSRSQAKVADLLGWTQSAVSQALRSGRDIRIVEYADGSISAYEVRQIAGAPVRAEAVAAEIAA